MFIKTFATELLLIVVVGLCVWVGQTTLVQTQLQTRVDNIESSLVTIQRGVSNIQNILMRRPYGEVYPRTNERSVRVVNDDLQQDPRPSS